MSDSMEDTPTRTEKFAAAIRAARHAAESGASSSSAAVPTDIITAYKDLVAFADAWEKPSPKDDHAWRSSFTGLKLDTDDADAMAKFHLWRKRMEIPLNRYK